MADQPGITSTDYKEKMAHSRYGRLSRSRKRSLKILLLSISLALALLILLVVSVYSTVKISSLKLLNRDLQYRVEELSEHIAKLEPELEQTKQELQQLVVGRFPNLYEFVVNRVLDVDNEHIKTVVFNIIKQSNRHQYKYLLVVENNSSVKIKPSFRVLLFDRFGVHMATDEVHDSNELSPGENRDYASDIEFFFDTEPVHFYIDDITVDSD